MTMAPNGGPQEMEDVRLVGLHSKCGLCEITSFKLSDAEDLAKISDNPKIWRNVRNRFPNPYTLDDAVRFITREMAEAPETVFAIRHRGELAGCIGMEMQTDVNTGVAELGFWLGEPWWNKGIMKAAVGTFTAHAFAAFPIRRLEAFVIAWNIGSRRVLEANGYILEGVLRQAVIKNGEIADQWIFGKLPSDSPIP